VNPIHVIRRPAGILAWLASVPMASVIAGSAALASASPERARLLSRPDPPLPPGWTEQPPRPDPARAHVALAGGIPGWQLTLMAFTVVLLAATLIAITYPGPGRTAAGELKHRLSHDRVQRAADPQGQPAALARPAPGRPRPLNGSQPRTNRSP
jgi:hypothetical protein